MKIASEQSDKNQQRRSPFPRLEEFVESVEDYQRNDESPEDHCSDAESHTYPSHQHAKLSHSSR